MEEGAHKRKGVDDKNKKDYEMFLQDIEEDKEIRENVNMYRVIIFIEFLFVC